MIVKRFKAIDYQWAIWKQEETIDQLLAMLPDSGEMYLEQLNKFTSDSRKNEWLSVRVLLYHLLGSQFEILYKPNGRPYLSDGCGYISISHTKGYVTVIHSRHKTVGIDIERTGERILRLAHKFVGSDETPDILEDNLTEIEMFTMIWSAKEVMFKCMDKDNVDFREHLHVDVRGSFQCKPFLNAYETRTHYKQNFPIFYMSHPGEFVMTWTSF